ncbi:hypothetical protein LUZ60_007380 [Juncus effusus]|nr:hypothetical protein LUZ60_007380 [Juncus effusus]
MGCWREWMPFIAMIVVDVGFAVMNTLIKVAISTGMHPLIIVTLRQLIATIFIAPIAYFRERKTRPKMTVEIFVYLFFGALLGASLTQYLFYLGLRYTSATFACAFLNIVPVLTFLLALPFGLDSLNLKSKTGVVKLVGTLICLMGTLLLIFYQGAPLITSHELKLKDESTTSSTSHNSMMGPFLLVLGCISWSTWFLVQAKTAKKYPAIYSATAIIFFLSFIQALAITLATEKGVSVWIPATKVQIITVLVGGIVGSGIGFLVMSWCIEKRGPVFTAAFTPLIQIMVAVLDICFLHEQLRLGSVLGSALVIAGLYFLLWGKSREGPKCEVKSVDQSGETQIQVQSV